MLNIGGPELLIILLVALIFLGPQRLPEVARQLGQAAGSLRSLASGFQAELEAATKPAADAIKPVSDAMKLDGPTDQAEAIAQTQDDPFTWAHRDPFSPSRPADPESLSDAARNVTYDDEDGGEKAVSEGGPTDLRDEDE